MSDFTLEAAMERARRAALAGQTTAFDVELQAIRTLDRDGTAPMRELRMLELVVRARQADLTAVDGILDALGSLAPSEWHRVHGWLVGAPEMEHESFAEFVRSLDRRLRRRSRLPGARRLTPVLAIALAASATALLLMAWRFTPLPPEETNLQVIEGVLTGRCESVEDGLPAAWVDRLTQVRTAIAPHASPEMATKATASLDALAKALSEACTAPAAGALSRQLIGPLAQPSDLRRLAEGVRGWRESPWIALSAWGDGRALAWSPSGEALFAWRTLLRHVPLAAWLPGWFGGDFRVDPLQDPGVRVRGVAKDETTRAMKVEAGTVSWPVTARRVGRHWVPSAMVDRWIGWQADLDPSRCNAAVTRQDEERLVAGLDAVTAWIQSWSQGAGTPAPARAELPWWVP